MMNPSASEQKIRLVLMIAGFLGATGILIGAFTSHGLNDWLVERGFADVAEKRVTQAETGVRYHLLHAATLLALSALSTHFSPTRYWVIVSLMSVGTLLFSGSLYLLVALNFPAMGAITPLGGLSWIAAWTLIMFPRTIR